MKKWHGLAGVVAMLVGVSAMAAEKDVPAALAFKMKSLQGTEVDLASYKGKVILVVNVASKCGLTSQYEQLQALHKKYAKDGLAVIGFPCNQFLGREPGTADEIRSFCKDTYGVEFELFDKVDVKGAAACPLYKHLTALSTKPKGAGEISWNFEKFLIDRSGNVVGRFTPQTKPDSSDVVQQIESELAKK